MTGPEPVVVASGLTVALGGRTILHHVDMTVTSGEVVALLGANGSGKSTLVRTLVGIVPALAGTVSIFGEPLGSRVAWNRVGYVPQRITAASGVPATAAEVVASGLLSGRSLRPPRRSRARIEHSLESVGLAERIDRPVATLSGGQQQRVLIARALVRKPDLLFLDEPVSGVDLPSQASFAQTLGHLRDIGTTVIVVLHEIGPFAPLIQRSVVLRQGQVVHDGAPPAPHPSHAGSGHDHVHPHEAAEPQLHPVPPVPEVHPDRSQELP